MVLFQALSAASTDLTLDTRRLAHVQILGNPSRDNQDTHKFVYVPKRDSSV